MNLAAGLVSALLGLGVQPLTPGDHLRSVHIGGLERTYLVHIPPAHDPGRPTPVVLVLHPFGTNARLMTRISGFSETADRGGFLAVYPNGSGRSERFLSWNEGGLSLRTADDVGFLAAVLDDLALVANVDPARTYAAGMSNGAMMCYRLAAELPHRIAAIASVAGTMAHSLPRPSRPVPVLIFHGTEDTMIPLRASDARAPRSVAFKPVEETASHWAEIDGCSLPPVTVDVPNRRDDGLLIRRKRYGPGKDGAEVVLYVIEGGGHTWPGREFRGGLLGKSAVDLPASDLIWKFFQEHPMGPPVDKPPD
jgi:polyhydroxybutyrate depolymerase